MLFSSEKYQYPDDIFDESRMSFGDHIEELRTRLIKALKGLSFFLLIGFVLDYVGEQIGYRNFGIGRPILTLITEPVESQVRDFYARRNERSVTKLREMNGLPPLPIDQLAEMQKRVEKDGLTGLTPEER
ncbi:MAG: hypothetical protein ACRCZF_22060, partial [Gemmataceae bacterium]